MSDLSCPKLALLTGYSSRQIQRFAANGEIPNAWLTRGGHWRFPESKELKKWVATAKKVRIAPLIPRKRFEQDNYIVHLTRLLIVLRKSVTKMENDELKAFVADTKELRSLLQYAREKLDEEI
jgi:predicted DNA-binding transcriptional regulator AlpA